MAYVRRLGKDRYQIVWLEGYVVGPDGKRQQHKRSETVRGSEAEARRRAAEIEAARPPASKLRDPEERIFARVAAAWLERRRKDVEAGRLEPGTWRRYEETLRLYALPELGSVPLSKLRPADVERAYAAAPPGSVKQLHAAVRQLLRWALRERWIGWDVGVMVQPPRQRAARRSPVPAHHARLILLAFQETPHWPLVLLAAVTGLRLGELLGLRWSDIDWENHAVWVRQALKEAGRAPRFGSTKQDEQWVAVVHPEVMEVLRDHRRSQDAARTRWRRDLDLVFPASDGSPLHRQNWYRRVWHPVLQTLLEPGQEITLPLASRAERHLARTGDSLQRLAWAYHVPLEELRRANQGVKLIPMPRYVPHQLRHSFVTTQLGGKDPMPLTAVARAGGWKDILTPARQYAGAITEDQRMVAEKAWRMVRALVRADPGGESGTPA